MLSYLFWSLPFTTYFSFTISLFCSAPLYSFNFTSNFSLLHNFFLLYRIYPLSTPSSQRFFSCFYQSRPLSLEPLIFFSVLFLSHPFSLEPIFDMLNPFSILYSYRSLSFLLIFIFATFYTSLCSYFLSSFSCLLPSDLE